MNKLFINVEKDNIWVIATEGFISARATLEAGGRKGDPTRCERRPNDRYDIFLRYNMNTLFK